MFVSDFVMRFAYDACTDCDICSCRPGVSRELIYKCLNMIYCSQSLECIHRCRRSVCDLSQHSSLVQTPSRKQIHVIVVPPLGCEAAGKV
jgi:hypothetical protein